MARRYYILRDGERLYRNTVQEISRLAQKTANAIGSAVQVHYTDTATTRTGKSHRAAPSKADTNVYSRNPAKAKPKATRAKSTRGFWVEYKMSGGKVQRIKAGNKGIATIRANELKRSGYKGVRVYSA